MAKKIIYVITDVFLCVYMQQFLTLRNQCEPKQGWTMYVLPVKSMPDHGGRIKL
jgi:hypothetical protein